MSFNNTSQKCYRIFSTFTFKYSHIILLSSHLLQMVLHFIMRGIKIIFIFKLIRIDFGGTEELVHASGYILGH